MASARGPSHQRREQCSRPSRRLPVTQATRVSAPVAGVAPERQHRVVVGARRDDACAVGRDGDGRGAREPADRRAVGVGAVAQAAGSGRQLRERPGRARRAGTTVSVPAVEAT